MTSIKYKVAGIKYGKKAMAAVLILFANSCFLFPATTRGRL